MKTLFAIFAVLFSVTLYAQNGAPKLSVDSMEYDFGDIYEGQIVNHEFVVTNGGQGILEISKVRSSCGCTAAKPAKNQLSAGESTNINVKFNTANRKGKQKKYVYVNTNDPKNPEIRLSFTANIVTEGSKEAANIKAPILKLSSNYHNFGIVKEGKILELNIPFKNEGNTILEISNVKSTCGCTAVLLSSKKLNPGESGNLRIEYDTTDRAGKTTRTITIYSNDPKNAQQVITIFAEIEE